MLELKFNKSAFSVQQLQLVEKALLLSLKTEPQQQQQRPMPNVLSKNRTDLYAHLLSIFVRCSVHKVFHVTTSQLLDFLIDVAELYTDAPYHTFHHAADVVTMLYYLCYDLNANVYLTDVDRATLMVAAICHDIGHPGFTNAFQINTKTDLAKRYGGKSTLETYSVDLTLKLLNKHRIESHVEINETIRDLILSTDMAYHSELQTQADQLVATLIQGNSTNKRKHSTSSVLPTLMNDQGRASLCRILLHAADISNMARPWMVSKQWSDLIVQEFFFQGDEEKKRNIAVSPGMDRQTCSQSSISLKFVKLIMPYFQLLARILPKAYVLVDHLTTNCMQWECLEPSNRPSSSSSSLEIIRTRRLSNTFANSADSKYHKRIRLGHRSKSYPNVLYHKIVLEENNLLPHFVVEFNKPTSCLYDNTIVLIHPYDQ